MKKSVFAFIGSIVQGFVSVQSTIEDDFINSPFLILAALLIVIAIVLVYRRVK